MEATLSAAMCNVAAYFKPTAACPVVSFSVRHVSISGSLSKLRSECSLGSRSSIAPVGPSRPLEQLPVRQQFRRAGNSWLHSRVSKRTAVCASQMADSAVSDGGSGNSAERRARLIAQRNESFELQELQRPLAEYMALPASQYSVLDAERIERLDENSFKCYAHRLKFFAFEVCPVLTVRVEERPDGCCIRLLSCTLEGSPLVVAQNSKFTACMENLVSWKASSRSPAGRLLVSHTTIEVSLVIPPAFSFLSVGAIESTGNQVLSQLLRLMLPRFLQQLGKDYKAWASGDDTRQALGTGEL